MQGGRVGIGCASVVEGQTMTFGGRGRRQAVTVDLDLRYARSAFSAAVVLLGLWTLEERRNRCPVLLSLYCIVIVSLNEINGDGDVI